MSSNKKWPHYPDCVINILAALSAKLIINAVGAQWRSDVYWVIRMALCMLAAISITINIALVKIALNIIIAV